MAQNQGDNPSQRTGMMDQTIPLEALQNVVQEQITWIQDLRLTVQRQRQELKDQEKEHRSKHQKCCYPYAMHSEGRRAQEMLKMLRPDIARMVKRSGELPTSVDDCFRKALHAKYHLTQTPTKNKAKKIRTFPICDKCGKAHPEGCRRGTNLCFKCGKEGHYARQCAANRIRIIDGA